jgi:hypothetical protein
LRVLGGWESASIDLPAEEEDEAYLQYFNAENEQEKDAVARSVLNERERMRYMRRKM